MKARAPLCRWLSALALLCIAGAASAMPQRDWPAIPAPSNAKTYWVAQYLEQNTVPMQIRGFESGEPLPDVLRYYERWFADKAGYGVSQVGPVRVLGARLGAYQVTVQLRAVPSGTVGRLVAAVLFEQDESAEAARDRMARIGRGFPRPAGSQVISDTLSFDPGQRNRTIMITNGVSVETNALYLREQMVRLGWSLLQDRTVEAGQRSALVFRRGNEEMVVTISRREDSYFVVASQTTPE